MGAVGNLRAGSNTMTTKKNKSKGRTLRVIFRGTTVLVKEGYDGTLEISSGKFTERGDWRTFDAAARYALKWVLEYGGQMDESYYERGQK